MGIPRGLLYYDYVSLWKTFFEELGVDVIVSDKSNKKILTDGVSKCIDDACLPVKLFHGQVMNLKDRVDYIFIPKIISVEKKTYQCPKILGIPSMVKHSVKDLPEIIDIEVNLRKQLYKAAILKLGGKFTHNISKIRKAYNNGLVDLKRYEDKFQNKMLSHAMDANISNYNHSTKIMLAGHSYNIYDEYLNMGLINKLSKEKVHIITPEMLSQHKDEYINQVKRKIFWSAGSKIVGTCFYAIEKNLVDGIIYLSSFGCGLDSIIIDIIQRKCIRSKVPFTVLVIDEHSGEAGFNTRLEAFLDMLEWRKNYENNISTHG